MGKVEKIEEEVRALSEKRFVLSLLRNLLPFANGSASLTRRLGIVRSRLTRLPVGSMLSRIEP